MTKAMQFTLIVAATEKLGIGISNNLPWRIPKDMAFFKHATTTLPISTTSNPDIQNVVIMGRVTWESIPPKFRPLDNRFNIVVSRNANFDLKLVEATNSNTILVDSLEKAFESIHPAKHARVFVIGGAQMYKLAIQHASCSHILLTRITSDVECDTFFPDINEKEYELATHAELEEYIQQQVPKGIQVHKELEYEFTLYKRKS